MFYLLSAYFFLLAESFCRKTLKKIDLKKFFLQVFFLPEGNSPSNADKSPVERLSLNRSQCGGYSTKYNTLTET